MGYDDEVVMLDEKLLCLAEVFRAAGYVTKGVISHVYVSAELGFDQGFDSYDEEDAQGHGHISSPSVTDKGMEFVSAHKEDKFFLFLHYFDPHCDYILHEPYNFFPDYDGEVYSGEPITDLRQKAKNMTPEDVRYLNALYDSEIRFTDEHVGRFLTYLKDAGLYDDALIVIVADHGEEFLERGDYWIGHTKRVYQELVHVPLIVKPPALAKPETVEANVSLIDLMPTVVAASGLEVPEGYNHDGRALGLEATGTRRDMVYSETKRWGTQQTVISEEWKLIIDGAANRSYLFDLDSDPGETTNLAEEHVDIAKQLRSAIYEWDYDLRMKRSKFRVSHPKLSPKDVEKLKSLGYVR
jgi:arylsulfatase A-like enzyme